jgi:hypothetical protein
LVSAEACAVRTGTTQRWRGTVSCGGGRNALSSRGWYREEDVGRDAIGKGTHRLRDEEREDAGDGGAAGHAAVVDDARWDGPGGSVERQPGCASTRRDVSRFGGVR